MVLNWHTQKTKLKKKRCVPNLCLLEVICEFLCCAACRFKGLKSGCPFNDTKIFSKCLQSIETCIWPRQTSSVLKLKFKLLVRLAYHCCPVRPSTSSVVFICCRVNLLM